MATEEVPIIPSHLILTRKGNEKNLENDMSPFQLRTPAHTHTHTHTHIIYIRMSQS